MKILIVHDRAEVATRIGELVKEVCLGHYETRIAADGVSARCALQEEMFDLAILDLTLPHIAGVSSTDYSVAEELIQELVHVDTLNAPGDIIGITKDPDALNRIDTQIGSHLMAIVKEDESGIWERQIKDRVAYTQRSARARQRSFNRHFDFDLAIITALDRELTPYNELFEFVDAKEYPGVKEFLFKDVEDKVRKGVAFAIGRAGQASAAASTQALITQFRPSLVLMTGFCGGFAAKAEIGDILIAESVFDWDCGKWLGEGNTAKFAPRPEPIVMRDTAAHQVARAVVQDQVTILGSLTGHASQLSGGRITQPRIKLGPIASGSAVVAEASVIARIQGLNEAFLGVDMEAYGFLYAATRTPVRKPECLHIKAVSDHADRAKNDQDQVACSYLSAKIAEDIVRRRWRFVQAH